MKTKLSILTQIIICSFIFVLVSSFSIGDETTEMLKLAGTTEFVRENWLVIALVVSEVAALLPGKPKGILQLLVIIGNHIFRKNKV